MSNTGKALENLVATVERILAPDFEVVVGERRYFESGQQEVEFDVQLIGKVGSASVKVLLECRDRPSQGTAPGSWIEQLVGRQSLYKFQKVVAVSTTGFSEAAIKKAAEAKIELRTVRDVDAESIRSWVQMNEFVVLQRRAAPASMRVKLLDGTTDELREEVDTFLANHKANSPILRSSVTGEMTSAHAVLDHTAGQEELYAGVTVDGPPVRRNLNLKFSDQDHCLLDLPSGKTVRVDALQFEVLLTVQTVRVPQTGRHEYRDPDDPKAIAQVVTYGPIPFASGEAVLEMHHTEKGTQILLRGAGLKPV